MIRLGLATSGTCRVYQASNFLAPEGKEGRNKRQGILQNNNRVGEGKVGKAIELGLELELKLERVGKWFKKTFNSELETHTLTSGSHKSDKLELS